MIFQSCNDIEFCKYRKEKNFITDIKCSTWIKTTIKTNKFKHENDKTIIL